MTKAVLNGDRIEWESVGHCLQNLFLITISENRRELTYCWKMKQNTI